ncbi:MAG: hypothetical protein V1773_07410 [bacterium]
MKNKIVVLFSLLFLVTFSNLINAQDDAEKQLIKTSVTKLFDLSKSKDLSAAAVLLVYTGDDQARNYKQAYNAANSEDLNQVKRLMKKIKALLDISDSNTFTDFGTSTKNDVKIYTITVQFKSGAQTLSSVFSFVKSADKFLLASVD